MNNAHTPTRSGQATPANPSKIKFWAKKLLYITGAIVLLAICVNMFLGPHYIAAGGLTGLAIILEEMWNIDRSLIIFIGNGALLVVTFFTLGREIFFNTVIGATMLPLMVRIVPQVMLVQDTMLSMIVGSFLFGIAVTMLYQNKASSGGTAIPPLMFKKYFNLNTSVGLFLTDGLVVLLCLFVFSVDAFFYAVFSIFITSATMGYIENGLSKKKMVYIISEAHTAITNAVLNVIGRGVTVVPVVGAYQNTQKSMLMVTLAKRDYRQLLDIVDQHDKTAFMITDTVSDVHGQGFTYESGTV